MPRQNHLQGTVPVVGISMATDATRYMATLRVTAGVGMMVEITVKFKGEI